MLCNKCKSFASPREPKLARYRARRAGRQDVRYEDVTRAVVESAMPSDDALANALAPTKYQRGRHNLEKVSRISETRPGAAERQAPCSRLATASTALLETDNLPPRGGSVSSRGGMFPPSLIPE